jgi:HEAT repeat protein
MFRRFQSAPVRFFLAVGLLGAALGSRVFGQEGRDEFEDWHLEPGLAKSHLVMVARVSSISQLTVVKGAKTDVTMREYRFQPVRRLKGMFQREQLSMTGTDLGIVAADGTAPPPLKEGEFRLLILVQQEGSVHGCVVAAPGATTFNERVPLLTGPDDPLVPIVETLIRVADSHSRRDRATMLVDRLADADGLSSVPLLSSLRMRADWAAVDARAYASLVRLASSGVVAVRGGALAVLRDMLVARIPPSDPRQLDSVAEAARTVLQSDEDRTRVRLAALGTLGHVLLMKQDIAWPRELLLANLRSAATHAERAAAVTALSRFADPQSVTAVHEALAALPLDEPAERESVYIRAATRLDWAAAERILITRLERSVAARQSLEAEITPLGWMRSTAALPLLLTASEKLSTSHTDRHHIAVALGRLGNDQAVPLLAGWLRNDSNVKEPALAALEEIDSPIAAREVRPLLKSESHLPYKLRIARLLARHGFADGYPLATEHLSDTHHTAAAALVLAALDDPRTTNDLSSILGARPDRRWYAATLTGLAATGDVAARRELREILANDRNPLAADAAEAAGLTDDRELLVPLANLARSRNRQIAVASLVALRRFLADVRSAPRGLGALDGTVPPQYGRGVFFTQAAQGDADATAENLAAASRPLTVDIPAVGRSAIVDAVASLVVDAYVDADVRQQALDVACMLGGDRYAQLLSELADQAELEGTPLLREVQAERRRLRERLEQRSP